MSDTIRIWAGVSHHAAFRCGGWAYVRKVAGQATGAAGGERATTAQRMALAGLAAALSDLPAGPVVVHTDSADMEALAALLPGGAPGEDKDLWVKVVAAVGCRKLSVTRTPLQPKTGVAFAAAWADLASDKAKATGVFKAAIPKPNLAKVADLLKG